MISIESRLVFGSFGYINNLRLKKEKNLRLNSLYFPFPHTNTLNRKKKKTERKQINK